MSAQPHPYAEILRLIADGKKIQWQDNVGVWHDEPWTTTLQDIANDVAYHPDRYRIKPAVILINRHEVPEPLRDMPANGTTVYWPGFGPDAGDDMTERTNVGYYPDMLPELMRHGLLHSTREAAQAHARALLSFTTKAGDAA